MREKLDKYLFKINSISTRITLKDVVLTGVKMGAPPILNSNIMWEVVSWLELIQKRMCSRMDQVKIFKGCLPENLVGPW